MRRPSRAPVASSGEPGSVTMTKCRRLDVGQPGVDERLPVRPGGGGRSPRWSRTCWRPRRRSGRAGRAAPPGPGRGSVVSSTVSGRPRVRAMTSGASDEPPMPASTTWSGRPARPCSSASRAAAPGCAGRCPPSRAGSSPRPRRPDPTGSGPWLEPADRATLAVDQARPAPSTAPGASHRAPRHRSSPAADLAPLSVRARRVPLSLWRVLQRAGAAAGCSTVLSSSSPGLRRTSRRPRAPGCRSRRRTRCRARPGRRVTCCASSYAAGDRVAVDLAVVGEGVDGRLGHRVDHARARSAPRRT